MSELTVRLHEFSTTENVSLIGAPFYFGFDGESTFKGKGGCEGHLQIRFYANCSDEHKKMIKSFRSVRKWTAFMYHWTSNVFICSVHWLWTVPFSFREPFFMQTTIKVSDPQIWNVAMGQPAVGILKPTGFSVRAANQQLESFPSPQSRWGWPFTLGPEMLLGRPVASETERGHMQGDARW